MTKPLAEILRPQKFKDYIGQEHIVGKEGIVFKLLTNYKLTQGLSSFPSLILWGPPGTGKTTLARIITTELKRDFHEFSAVNTSSKDIEKVIKDSTAYPLLSTHSPVIFLDEIHRFNKAQQDRLLPHVESGKIILIGATTENPSFEVIGPLLSRMKVLVLKNLETKELKKILKRGLEELSSRHPEHSARHLELFSGSKGDLSASLKMTKGKLPKQVRHDNLTIDKKAEKFLIESSNGDARSLLNTLEIASNLIINNQPLTIENIEVALQRRYLTFDKNGDEFYNIISAFIKSMRASNTDAALYYLARMVEAGQDPLYIARRMVIFASEDIGMAQPTALVVANSVFQACQQIGYPECQENLAHGVVYLSEAKKDRSAYDAYMTALSDVRKYGNLPIPKEILNAPTKLMKELDYGKGYEMYSKKSLLPDKIKNRKYFTESNGK